MSRIGKLPVKLPQGVKVNLGASSITIEGPKGRLEMPLDPVVSVESREGAIHVMRKDDDRRARGVHGLTRKLVANMVEGVSAGFTRVLEINGVGYRAEVKGNSVHFSLGYSHPIVFQLPKGVSAKVDKQTVVTLQSADKQVLGEVAAMVRSLRPPEPYKGKGVKYAEERIRRKAGKAAGAAS